MEETTISPLGESLPAHTAQLSCSTARPSYNMQFKHDSEVIGTLDSNGPELIFTGNADESATKLFAYLAESFKGRLREEFNRGRESASCEQR